MGGVASVIKNYYQLISHEVVADFIVTETDERIPKDLREELNSKGCHIFHVTHFAKNMWRYYIEVGKIIKIGNYDIIHDNTKYFSLSVARKCKVPVRICHVHNTVAAKEKWFLHRWFIYFSSKLSVRYATSLLACSKEAGESMFDKHSFIILNNAIEPESFQFDKTKRDYWRNEFDLNDKFVLLMVARNDPLKRYDFAFKVFGKLFDIRNDARFLVVGLSENECQERDKLSLDLLPPQVRKNIVMLGRRLDAHELLSAGDAFILTSEHEGFGISIVEAQANGLPCFVSDAIPHATKCTDLVHFMPTLREEDLWAKEISVVQQIQNRKDYSLEVEKSEYSIKKNKEVLMSIYGDENEK